jgi:hypothetical protein
VIRRVELNCLFVFLNGTFDIDLDRLITLVGTIDRFDVITTAPADCEHRGDCN